MGLDMYLEKTTYVQRWDHIPKEEQFSVTVKRGGERYLPIKSGRIKNITEEVGYWRKANAIHQWFVDNVQDGVDDCRRAYVEKEQLVELRDICKQIKENPKLAPELLPTQGGGVFFGSTEYDEYYMEDIEATIKILDDILVDETSDKLADRYAGSDYYYIASW